MGAGGSFNYTPDFKRRRASSKVAMEKFVGVDPVPVVEQKQAADFRGVRQLSLPILQTKAPEGPVNRRPLKTQQSIKAMSLRNRSRHENSYRIQKELASSLVSLHKLNYTGDKSIPTKARTHERIDSILSSLDIVNNHYFSTNHIKVSDDKFPVKTDAILILQAQRTETKMVALPPPRKSAFGLHKSKRPPALKINIQDDSDWIQVEDEDGAELVLSPRALNNVPLKSLKGNKDNEQSYIFTQSGTIFVEGFLEGIGKEGIVGTRRPLSSNRGPKLPMRDRLVLLCKLGHGASGVVYKALDLIDMRLVALKMISVFEHGKRRQMVRELSALFQVLRQKKLDFKKIQMGGKLKGVRSQFSLRSISEEAMKKKLRSRIAEAKSISPSPCPTSSTSNSTESPRPLTLPSLSSSPSQSPSPDSDSGQGPGSCPPDSSPNTRNTRKSKLLEAMTEIESEKTLSQSVESSCSTPSSSCGHKTRFPPNESERSLCKVDCSGETMFDEYGLRLESGQYDYKEDDDEEKSQGTPVQEHKSEDKDWDKEDKDSGLEKFFVKPASEFIVDFFDAFSNIDDGGVALMMEYMDGGSLQDIVDDGGCDDEITLSNIAVQALIGLAFLHSCGQLHRDLKPGNFLISHRGDVKVADLGILCQLDERRAPTDEGEADVKISNRRSDGSSRHGRSSRMTTECLSDTAEASDNDESPSPPRGSKGADSPIPHTKTFVGTVTFMSPERIDGREYSYPSDVWAFGLSLMTLALGALPIETQGGYWTILHCIRDAEPPTLPDDGRFSEDFRDFLCACLQKDPKNRLTCNQLLLHPFLRKAVPEECGIGTHGISGKNSKRQLEAESEAREVQSRGIVELHSILAALHLHFERIQLGISPKSGLQICETSQSHPFFSGLKTARLEDFLRHFLLGNGMVVEESNEVERSVETVLEPNMRPSSSFMDHVNDENKLDTLARQLHLTPDTIKDEIKTYCESLDNGLWKKQMEKPPRRFSRVSTPKASHSGLKESK